MTRFVNDQAVLRRGDGPFRPFADPATLRALLFGTSNATGFTFEPWDITTLYQDRAGTTPVTAVGQSVGLRLSKDQGLRIGPELVTNGDFASGAIGWTLGTDWSISGGFASRGANVTASNLTGGSGVEAGKTYRVTWTQGAEAVAVYLGSAAGPLVSNTSAAGTYSRLILATVTGGIVFRASASVSSIDNISVRELAGNHEVAINDAARGVYGREPENGTRNRLTYTEQFDNAAWTKSVATVTPNAAVAPDGATTADLVAGGGFVRQQYSISASAVRYTYSVYAKASANTSFAVTEAGATGSAASFVLSGEGTVVVTNLGGSPSGTILNVGDGWYRCTFSYTTNGVQTILYLNNTATSAFLWGAQLELGASATAYQKAVSQYDVTEAGVPSCYYAQTDGVDDAYVTPTITPGTDKVQVFAGVRKNSDAAINFIAETSTNAGSNAGSLMLYSGTDRTIQARARGSVDVALATTALAAAPLSFVATLLGDISGDASSVRINGVSRATSSADHGTGNYLAYPAYIYARAGTSFPFSGRDYGHAVRFGPNLDAATIARVEALIARNTPEVTL